VASSTAVRDVDSVIDSIVDVPLIREACLRLRHGSGISFITLVFTAPPEFDGAWEMQWGTTPSGPLTGTGTMTGGLVFDEERRKRLVEMGN